MEYKIKIGDYVVAKQYIPYVGGMKGRVIQIEGDILSIDYGKEIYDTSGDAFRVTHTCGILKNGTGYYLMLDDVDIVSNKKGNMNNYK